MTANKYINASEALRMAIREGFEITQGRGVPSGPTLTNWLIKEGLAIQPTGIHGQHLVDRVGFEKRIAKFKSLQREAEEPEGERANKKARRATAAAR